LLITSVTLKSGSQSGTEELRLWAESTTASRYRLYAT
jgi:hypothetical protein